MPTSQSLTPSNLEATFDRWVPGGAFGLDVPANVEALREGGERFLTEAFRAAGAIAPDNAVARVTRMTECPGGSTGRKLFLSVEYDRPGPELRTNLFVKFSRDFDDPIRDRGRDQLESEVKFALLSRTPGFPVTVPRCYFADYHATSGTGLLITETVEFGVGAVEPHHEKCLDHLLPEPLDHYRALVRALAVFAGAHKGGRLPEYVSQTFPFDPERAKRQDRIRYTASQLEKRVERFGEFSAAYPQLFPQNIVSRDFLVRFASEIAQVIDRQDEIKAYLYSSSDLIALCHWNANIDNAWFWRDATGGLQCGLMDWGRVDQMNVGQALAGALMGAEVEVWDNHLDELLALFVKEFASAGGASIDAGELKLNLRLYVAASGVAWLMDAPALISANIADLALLESARDRRLEANETARTQLHMITVFLNVCERCGLGRLLEEMGRRTAAA